MRAAHKPRFSRRAARGLAVGARSSITRCRRALVRRVVRASTVVLPAHFTRAFRGLSEFVRVVGESWKYLNHKALRAPVTLFSLFRRRNRGAETGPDLINLGSRGSPFEAFQNGQKGH